VTENRRGGGQAEVNAIDVALECQRRREIVKDESPEGIAEAQAVKEARILGGRRSVRVRYDGRAFRVRLGHKSIRRAAINKN